MEEEKEKPKEEDNKSIDIKEITSNFKKARKMNLFKPPDLRKRKKSVMFLEAPKELKLNNIKKTEIIMNPNVLQQKLQSEILHSKTKKSKNKLKTDKNCTTGILPPIKTKVLNINKHFYIPIFSKFDPTAFLENVKKRPSFERIRTLENDPKIEFNNIKKTNKFSTTLCIKKLKNSENIFKENNNEIENGKIGENGENDKEKEDDVKIKINNKKNKANKSKKKEKEKEKKKEKEKEDKKEDKKDKKEDKKIDDNGNKEIKMDIYKKEENQMEKENKDNLENCINNEDKMTNNRVIIHIQNKSADNREKKKEKKRKIIR